MKKQKSFRSALVGEYCRDLQIWLPSVSCPVLWGYYSDFFSFSVHVTSRVTRSIYPACSNRLWIEQVTQVRPTRANEHQPWDFWLNHRKGHMFFLLRLLNRKDIRIPPENEVNIEQSRIRGRQRYMFTWIQPCVKSRTPGHFWQNEVINSTKFLGFCLVHFELSPAVGRVM